MGKITELYIKFDSPKACYQDGESIRGQVVIKCTEETKLKALTLEFQGVCLINWRGNMRNVDLNKPIPYSEKEQYLKQTMLLIKKGQGSCSKDPILPAGSQSFPFAFDLPQGIPSSFSGQFGTVLYWVKAVLERPRKSDQEIRQAFTVINPVDLNLIPHVTVPVNDECHKSINGLCWPSGSITANWSLEKTGYIPGEGISVNGAIQNDSRKKVLGSKAEIIQEIEFHARNRRAKETSIVAVLHKGEIESGKCEIWHDAIQVPAVPATGISGCSYIDVKYKLKISVITGASSPIEYIVDVVIGTIPIVGNVAHIPDIGPPLPPRDFERPPPLAPSHVNTQAGPSVLPTAPSIHTIQRPWREDMPPSYEQSMLVP